MGLQAEEKAHEGTGCATCWVISLGWTVGVKGVVVQSSEAGGGRGWGVDTVAPILPGAVPATGFLRQSGIGLDSRGFIPVNKVGLGGEGRQCAGPGGGGRSRSGRQSYLRAPVPSPQMMQTNVPGVFAAGDAVTFPLAWRNNRKVNIPHWQMAHAQGTGSPMAAWGGRLSQGLSLPQAHPLSCWPWVLFTGSAIQGSVAACPASPMQVVKAAHRDLPSQTSVQCPLDIPFHQPQRPTSLVPPPASLSFPFVLGDTCSAEFLTNLCSHPGRERGV